MKKIVFLSALALATFVAGAQDFPGFRVGNYTGVNGVFFNPANIADSRYRFDINLFSVSTMVGQNQAAFKLSDINTFDSDKLSDNLFSGGEGNVNALVSANVQGPSFMFNLNKKSTIAVTTRARAMVNVVDINGKLLQNIMNDLNANATLPYSINSNDNMRVALNGWSEIGASYARVISEKGPHFLKGGVTLKYLGGAGNGFINVANLKSTINQDALGDVYLNNTTGQIAVGFGGKNLSGLEASNLLAMESSGFGADLGFVYEYRPASAGNDANKYKFKVGVALMDLGSVRYKKDMDRSGAYNLDITGSERFYLREIENEDLENYNRFFRSRPQFFTPSASNSETSYSVSLPSTLNVDVDYHINKGFYVSASGLISLMNKSKVENPMYYSSFAVTPRVEGRIFGVYLPISYNQLTNLNAGLSLRMGPVFIGSGSIVSLLVGESKQADVHIGVRFGGLVKK
ncbi:DUF5723 family protein [Aridibaculum aurantiacum]|uniref:DUF5723 family protein n=1 Tax=Aridibaculum aurantiacum TaxID=2810307 RepID=UPI001A967CD5|nr:DUF5723 family protein [Aridibaculum aurantiacum]